MTSAVAALRRVAAASAARPRVTERCELCAAPLDPARHSHLFEATTRRLACTCSACAACFDRSGERRWTRVVSRAERLDATLDVATWNALGVPVRLAYFTPTTSGEPLAMLPSPAGPIASPIADGGWEALRARVPVVSALGLDVEGVLAWDPGGTREGRAYRLSIDHAYRAIGVLRARAAHATVADLARILEDEVLPTIEREGA